MPRQHPIIGQRVQVGLRYPGQIVTIEIDETTLRVYNQRDQLIKMFLAPAARTSADTRPTVTPPTTKPARHRYPSSGAKTAPII